MRSRAYMPDPVKRRPSCSKLYFAAVGSRPRLCAHEWAAYLSKVANGIMMCMFGWLGGNADPDNFLYGLLSADMAKPPAPPTRPSGRSRVHDLCLQGERSSTRPSAQALSQGPGDLPRRGSLGALAHSTIVRGYSKKLHDVPLDPTADSFQMVSKDK